MAYSFQVPRQRTRPLTQGAQLAEDQNTQGLATGNFGDVQSARGATDRSNALRTSQALQATRGTFARSGVDTSPEAAARAQDQSFSAAEGQNLNGTNAVNQLQRQYRNDAVTNANQYEAAANQREQQGVSNDQFQQTFGANREDAATARNQFGLNYNAGREDANTAKTQFGETMAQRKNEFGVSSGQSQQQIDNQSKQFLTSQAQRDKEFGQTFAAGREDAADSRSRFDLSRGDTNSQFDKTLGQRQSEFGVSSSQQQQQIDNQAKQAAEKMGYDYASLSQNDKQFFQKQAQEASQFGVTSGQNQQQINNQASQFGQNYAAGREDAATAKNQFNLTRGDKNSQFNVTANQSQQQIDNQAEQAAKKMGYDYRALDQNDKQFFQKMAQEDDQFLQKTNFDYNSLNQTLGENARQFDAKLGQEGSQFQSKLRQDENQFGVTSGMTQQQIDNQRNQFDKNYNQSGSQFDQTLAQNKSQFDLTRGDKQKSMTMDEINTIQDPVARNLALKAYYGGGDVGKAIGGNILASGELDKKSMSPGTAAYQAKVDELQATYPDKSQAQIEQMVRDRAAQSDTLTQGVSNTATKAVAQQASMENLSKLKPGETPNPGDLRNLPSVNPSAIPLGSNVASFLKTNTTGGWTNIGGQPYKVVSGDRWTTEQNRVFGKTISTKHEDFAVLKDQNGKTMYLNARGQISSQKPGA